MHDIDRTFMEYTPELESDESEDGPFEYMDAEWFAESDEVFGEEELLEMASEFLEITDEEELDYFLGGLIKKAAGAVGSAIKSPVGRALGGVLKGAAKKALPLVGSAIGGYVGGSSGAKIGGKLASNAGRLFGLEMEGLSHEDEVFEVAKQYVRFAGNAAKNAATASGGDPKKIVQAAVRRAAQRYAPGLIQAPAGARAVTTAAPQGAVRGHSGRWVRRGNRIFLYGV